ncbi:MAG: TIGR02677 family protein [Eubacterium sp.]|nr:TIGR02677 family protein [Eubacterium sp.]
MSMTPIRETSYLTAQNCERYRHIMRMFYREMDKNHNQIRTEEMLTLLREGYPDIFDESYDSDMMRQDLDALVGWHNLTPYQDTRRVYTVADYLKKQYRYEMTEEAVEVERMTLRLETLYFEPASLSSNFFRRIEEALEHRPDVSETPLGEVHNWWDGLQTDFTGMNQNYKDYLREFHTGESEKILKSVEFVIHKDRFIAYLHDFIRNLQQSCDRIAYLLGQISEEEKNALLSRVVESELDIPRPDMAGRPDRKSYYEENIPGKWESLERWFISKNGQPRECSQVLDITGNIIQRIIQNAALIIQLQNWGISRKSDYKHYMQVFAGMEDTDDAHKLAAHVFGIQQVRHFRVTGDRETDSINSSTSEESAVSFQLQSHARKYKSRMDRTGFEGKDLKKAQTRRKHLERLRKERRLMERYTRGDRLAVAEIDEVVPEFVRVTILSWISRANMRADHTGQTDFGRSYRVEPTQERCVLRCEDGDLEMPAYTICFDKET